MTTGALALTADQRGAVDALVAGSAPGAHAAIGRFLEIVFDEPPAAEAAAAFDTLRMIRNVLRYQAKSPSRAETATASGVARDLLSEALRRLPEARRAR